MAASEEEGTIPRSTPDRRIPSQGGLWEGAKWQALRDSWFLKLDRICVRDELRSEYTLPAFYYRLRD